MRIIFPTLLIATLFLMIAPAFAAGFQESGARKSVGNVEEALMAPDGAPCALEGRLLEKIHGRKNRYLFEDRSGRIIVRIRRHVFGDFTVTPDHLVRLVGKIDGAGVYPNEVDADYLGIVGPAASLGH